MQITVTCPECGGSASFVGCVGCGDDLGTLICRECGLTMPGVSLGEITTKNDSDRKQPESLRD